MLRYLLVLILVFFTCGCAPTVTKIPIALPCVKSKLPEKPELPVYALTENSQPDEVSKAYVASVKILNNYIDSISNI